MHLHRPAPRIAKWLPIVGLMTCLLASAPATSAEAPKPSLSTLVASLHGKVVLLDFWASWCEPCRHSFPWMSQLQKQYGADLAVVAVNLDQDPQLARQFLQATPAAFRVEYDPSGTLATQFEVTTMPTSFLIDRNGTVRARHRGFREAQRAERERAIAQLLKE